MKLSAGEKKLVMALRWEIDTPVWTGAGHGQRLKPVNMPRIFRADLESHCAKLGLNPVVTIRRFIAWGLLAESDTPGPYFDITGKVLDATENDVKRKQSTEQGEARAKIIAALTKHHQYKDNSCLSYEPIGVNELARKLDGVSNGSVSRFFKIQFCGHANYRAACRDPATLANALRMLNGELTPSILFKQLPADAAE